MKRKTALYGLLVALAFIFSYLESLFPLPIGVPGVKLGLANSVVLVALYRMRPVDAFVLSGVRILLAGITFGTVTSMLYSLAGGVVSFLVMWLCRRSPHFSVVGVSIAGGVSHNMAQLAVAMLALSTPRLVWYLPVLLIAGLISGGLIGVACHALLPKLRKIV